MKQPTKAEAEKMYDNLMLIDAFLNGLEIACDENRKELVYEIKQKSFEIRGFLLRMM
ncbi:hypothetical protein MUP79_10255 [Candidatus Bathyarchaeota archaeon]|nr:hypothetical protein [Candidatus Bathyarchaeota archaeon]